MKRMVMLSALLAATVSCLANPDTSTSQQQPKGDPVVTIESTESTDIEDSSDNEDTEKKKKILLIKSYPINIDNEDPKEEETDANR